jgi:hypothetical protein
MSSFDPALETADIALKARDLSSIIFTEINSKKTQLQFEFFTYIFKNI